MTAMIPPRSYEFEARLHSRGAVPSVLDGLLKRVKDNLCISSLRVDLETDKMSFENTGSVTSAYERAGKAKFAPQIVMVTLSDSGEANVLAVRVNDCRLARPYVQFKIDGPAAARWMETVCRAVNDLSDKGLMEYPPRGTGRIKRVMRSVRAFLTGMSLWEKIVGGTVSGAIVALLVWFLT